MSAARPAVTRHHSGRSRGGLHLTLMLIFGLQSIAIMLVWLVGYYMVAPLGAVLLAVMIVMVLTWFAVQSQWWAIGALARFASKWSVGTSPAYLTPMRLSRFANADVAMLTQAVRTLLRRIAGYGRRERDFTRDISHELRTPLTVIKMSVDLAGEEMAMSEFGRRSLQRIRRATREMEILVEAMLVLAREEEQGDIEGELSVNAVLREEIDMTCEVLYVQAEQLQLREATQLTLRGSPRVFAVLCRQLIRQACHYARQGSVMIEVMPSKTVSISASILRQEGSSRADVPAKSFEYTIAQQICRRFDWPLHLHITQDRYVATIHFPKSTLMAGTSYGRGSVSPKTPA